ncbi:transposon Ty3-I Gag-Pol polyprotein [Trichonephila clavipes]|nr:transposon Ty3-I Gag-Pol polyprotein [Trichonephila clavipes]
MRIILKDEEPVCQPPRRLAFTERQEVNKQKNGSTKALYVRCSAEYASPIVMKAELLKPSPTKTLAVRKFPEPTTIKKNKYKKFSGLTGYFRKYIKDYSKIAKPLSDLTRKAENPLFSDSTK